MSSSQNLSLITTHTSYSSQLHSSWGEVQATVFDLSRLSLALLAFYAIGRIAGNLQVKRDLVWLAGALLLTRRDLAFQALWQCGSASAYLYVTGTLVLQMGAAVMRSGRWLTPPDTVPSAPSLLKPMLFPGKTTHTRLFPSRHSFSYSYLLVGVPIQSGDIPGDMLSVGEHLGQHGWFSVRADDYLSRGNHPHGLNGKLQTYLSTQGVSADRYPHAYLVTAPRFLGFSFNPVSFWYLYDHDWRLSAMILEVNNTFDERRMYFMENETGGSTASAHSFSNSWKKDFHVSPFNDREGSYSLTAKDIFYGDPGPMVDNNIVLKSEEGKAKIVARIFSTEPGIDPGHLSHVGKWAVLAKWGWVGFMTNPRILKEARVLWVKKLQLYYRPEVFKSSIGRKDAAEETNLETYFRSFLGELASLEGTLVSIAYTPAAGRDTGTAVRLPEPKSRQMTEPAQSLDITVLTPAFYGELARSSSIGLAFTRYCFEPAEGGAMLYVSDHDVLRRLLGTFSSLHSGGLPQSGFPSIRQTVVSMLRVGSKECSDGLNMIQRLARKSARPSEFDHYVRLSYSPSSYELYLRNAGRLLLADRIALGFGGILSVELFLVQLACIAQTSSILATLCFDERSKADLLALSLWTVTFHLMKSLLG